MTVLEIVEKYLKENGFAGLSGDECGCGLDDLMACECDVSQCRPAKKFKCKIDCERFDDCCGEVGDVCYRVKE